MVGYPTKKTAAINKSPLKSYGKRGMSLEDDLNATNAYYLDLDIALIHKKPTPIQVVKVDYAKRSAAKITEAYYRTPSTTDYNGVYRSRAIDFEAKETSSKTSFVLSLIHKHQLKHLQMALKHGCIAFMIIRFSVWQETYFVKAADIIELSKGARRSIPYKWFKENAFLIPFNIAPPIHYLSIVDNLYFKETGNEKTNIF